MPFNIDAVRELRPGSEFHFYPVLDSTMTEAARLANEGAPHGTVVVADEQLKGVGRLGRSWFSEFDVGLYTSVLLRLPLPPAKLPVVSLAVGLAAAAAIQNLTDLTCDLRWPNDVLISQSKVAGILTQLVGSYVVAGIGINVNNSAFPNDLRTPATSLLLSSGCRHSRESLLLQLLSSLDNFCDLLVSSGTEAVLSTFANSSSYVRDRRVFVEETGMRGITAGLDENGFLLLRSDAGELHRISSGGIRPDSRSSS